MIARAKRAVNYTAKDYIQDGLVAMWDGIENAGYGVHDDNIRVLKDLVGDNKGFYYIIPYNNYVMFEPAEGWVDRNLGTAVDEAFSSNNFTLEIVCNIVYDWPTGNVGNIWYGRTQNGGTTWMNSISLDELSPQGVRWMYYQSGTYYRPDITFRQKIASSTMTKANSDPRTYYNGNFLNTLPDTNTHIYGSRSLFYPNIAYYSVRIYNRALSEDEIRYNYMIDKWRFGI